MTDADATITARSTQPAAPEVTVSRDMVRRVFQELEDDGAIRLDRRQVTLLHPPQPR